MKQIGLFGGTFDPIHIGHLRAAVDVQENYGLNRVILIPAAVPPHKDGRRIGRAQDRLEMTRLAVAPLTSLAVSDVELQRKGPSYTIDTVRYFQQAQPSDTRLFLILGLDAFLEIETWRDYLSLFRTIALVVMLRPDGSGTDRNTMRAKVTRQLETHVASDYRWRHDPDRFVHPDLKPIYVCPVTLLDLSSTEIRARVAARQTIRYLVPEAVEQYIKVKGLYQ